MKRVALSILLHLLWLLGNAQNLEDQKRAYDPSKGPAAENLLDVPLKSNLAQLLEELPIDHSTVSDTLLIVTTFNITVGPSGELTSIDFIPTQYPILEELIRKQLTGFKSNVPTVNGKAVSAIIEQQYALSPNPLVRKLYIYKEDSLGNKFCDADCFIAVDSDPTFLNEESILKSITYPEILLTRRDKPPKIVFRLLISPQGNCLAVVTVRASRPGLKGAIIPSLLNAKFSVPTAGGKPIYYWRSLVLDIPYRMK